MEKNAKGLELHERQCWVHQSAAVRSTDRILTGCGDSCERQAASFEFPMTLGLLAVIGQLDTNRLDQYAVVRELTLDWSTRPIKR